MEIFDRFAQEAPNFNLMRRVWLIGGTHESAKIASAIALAHIPCIVSVTTDSARLLYPPTPCLSVWVGCITPAQILDFLHQNEIWAILDASHPYAVEISQTAIAVAQQQHLPYLRYERPQLCALNCGETYVDSFETLLSSNYLHGRVLLTVGYRPLHLFQPWQDKATLFARILPSAIALAAALQSGFTPERLVCIRPPISPELEIALWRQWQIQIVVTKASGSPGGEDIKRRVANELGIQLILIDRPTVNYPQQTSDLDVALAFCAQHSNGAGEKY